MSNDNQSPVNWNQIYDNITKASSKLSNSENRLMRSKTIYTNAYQKAKVKKNLISLQTVKQWSQKVKNDSSAVEQAKLALQEANAKLVLGKEKSRQATIVHSTEAQKHGIQMGVFNPYINFGGKRRRRTVKHRMSRRRNGHL